MTAIEPRDLLAKAEGRARFLRDQGEIKTPELIDELKAELTEARERLQAILDWADFAMQHPEQFKADGARNLTGPVFDAARAFLKGENNDG